MAFDPEKKLQEALKTKEHHMMILIDGDGIIQSVHTGLSFDGPETYEREIRVLMGGGSLLPRKPETAAKPVKDSSVVPPRQR